MKFYSRKFLTIVSFMFFYGCASSPPANFYLLDSGSYNQGLSATDSVQNKLIGIGPVRLPDYLDRPQIVTRSSENKLVLSDVHRWAESLEENFTRVLAENISRLLGTDGISIEPSRNRTSLDLRIIVTVLRFDADDNGEIHLVSYWGVENPDGSQRVSQRRSDIRVTGYSNTNYPAIVAAMSDATSQLAAEISSSLLD